MDDHSRKQIALAHPVIREDMTAALNECNAALPVNVHITWYETLRSFARTDDLYKLGRTAVNPNGRTKNKPFGDIVSWAKAGSSWHNWGLAGDIQMFTNGKLDMVVGPNWMFVVSIMKKHGFTWGGDFPEKPVDKTDPPHFEKKYGQTLSGLLALRKVGKFIPGTEYVDFITK